MDAKQELREETWAALRAAGAARFPGVEGRIPNFVGAEAAADFLAALPEWQTAATLKANPDSPQWPVRAAAFAAGKVLYMAVPRLAEDRPFWRLAADAVDAAPRKATSIKGAATHGRPVAIDDMEPIDLVVCGSVAVDETGARLGKGGGFSDLEFALAVEAGLIGEHTVIATTVHPAQVVAPGRIEMTAHDFGVDLVVAPDEVIRCRRRHRRPPGILWDHLEDAKIAAIPVLQARRP